VRMYVCACLPVFLRECTCVFVCVCAYVCVRVCPHVRARIGCVCMFMRVRVYVYRANECVCVCVCVCLSMHRLSSILQSIFLCFSRAMYDEYHIMMSIVYHKACNTEFVTH